MSGRTQQGAPMLGLTVKGSSTIAARITNEELAALRSLASREGLPVGTVIRRAIQMELQRVSEEQR